MSGNALHIMFNVHILRFLYVFSEKERFRKRQHSPFPHQISLQQRNLQKRNRQLP